MYIYQAGKTAEKLKGAKQLMTVEQTRWFREEVEHMVEMANNWRFTSKWDDIMNDHMMNLARLRGQQAAKKAAAKANQRLHAKVYAAG